MDWTRVFLETLQSSYSTIMKMVLLFIPLLIAIECFKDMGWLEKISKAAGGATRLMRLPGETAIAIIVGMLFGLLLGSGVVMQIIDEVKVTRTQLNTMFIFIGVFHAVIEETIIFTTVGANVIAVFLGRLITSLIFVSLYIKFVAGAAADRKEQKVPAENVEL